VARRHRPRDIQIDGEGIGAMIELIDRALMLNLNYARRRARAICGPLTTPAHL
jgi:hypothetical protein